MVKRPLAFLSKWVSLRETLDAVDIIVLQDLSAVLYVSTTCAAQRVQKDLSFPLGEEFFLVSSDIRPKARKGKRAKQNQCIDSAKHH
jgi:hypothetical protein